MSLAIKHVYEICAMPIFIEDVHLALPYLVAADTNRNNRLHNVTEQVKILPIVNHIDN